MHELPLTGFLRQSQILRQRAVSEAEAAANRDKAIAARAKLRAARSESQKKAARRELQNIGPRRPRAEKLGLIPLGHTAWWDGIAAGRFPPPLKLGPRATVWRVEDIRALLEGRWSAQGAAA